MKTKIIDLFNKITNREEVPKEITVRGKMYKWNELDRFYENENEAHDDLLTLCESMSTYELLSAEVEIIEKDKPIEEIKTEFIGNNFSVKKIIGKNGKGYSIREVDNILINKINELVKEITKMKENQ